MGADAVGGGDRRRAAPKTPMLAMLAAISAAGAALCLGGLVQ